MNERIKEILSDYDCIPAIEELGFYIKRLLEIKEQLQQENEEKGKEIERLNNKIKEQNLLLIEFQDMEQKVDIYKSRCKKAIEYIKMYKCDYSPYELTDSAIRNVLNILNGSDDK